ncbi:hypothetical protein H072_10359 [Dactylellina haptotyla CBS 200.50]|uniref:Protein ORM1 n=1 Tax=Dactylellina haptotyla (strain CBS 200.50) TaxID=1284197 RepID=S8BAN7_DACHA|nr:hypothetical protein H072_10359 [Dactylellina haptotyla CBS 200.50]
MISCFIRIYLPLFLTISETIFALPAATAILPPRNIADTTFPNSGSETSLCDNPPLAFNGRSLWGCSSRPLLTDGQVDGYTIVGGFLSLCAAAAAHFQLASHHLASVLLISSSSLSPFQPHHHRHPPPLTLLLLPPPSRHRLHRTRKTRRLSSLAAIASAGAAPSDFSHLLHARAARLSFNPIPPATCNPAPRISSPKTRLLDSTFPTHSPQRETENLILPLPTPGKYTIPPTTATTNDHHLTYGKTHKHLPPSLLLLLPFTTSTLSSELSPTKFATLASKTTTLLSPMNMPEGGPSRLHSGSISKGRRRRSSSIIYVEPQETIEQLSDQVALPNLNANWVNNKGAWLIHPVCIAGLKIFYDSIPGVSQETSWTLTNITYMFATYLMFHYVQGIPFEFNSGAYDNLNMWEQMDNGDQYTPSKKFLTSVPILLFLLSTHYTHYDVMYFVVNCMALMSVIIPKLPSVHRMRVVMPWSQPIEEVDGE